MILGWSPGIGDPTPLGWATAVGYALAAWLCARACAATPVELVRIRRFWLTTAIAMVALAVNKQLDLQSLLTAIGRRMAHDEGWYDARRTVQRAFIAAVMLAGGGVLGVMLWHLRRARGWVWSAALGLAFLVVFVVARAASFYHMDAMLGAEWAGVLANHLLELGGIAVIALGAVGDHADKSTCRQL